MGQLEKGTEKILQDCPFKNIATQNSLSLTHLLPSSDITADTIQDQFQVGPVPQGKVHQSDGAMPRPGGGGLL